MAVKHLTDMDFQEYLEREKQADIIIQDAHLMECKKCRLEFEHYRLLYNGLKSDAGYNLNPGFSETVVTRILMNQVEQPQSLFDKIMYLSGLIVAILLGGYFLNLKEIASAMAGPFVPIIETIESITSRYIEIVSVGGSSMSILIASALILAGVYFADNLLLNYKNKRFCL